MDEKEVKQIAEEIENNEELGTEENEMSEEELEALDAGEEEYIDDEDDFEEEPEREIIQVTETVNIVQQPIVTTVAVYAEVGAKGEIKPTCKATVERHLSEEEVVTDAYSIVATDFKELSKMVEAEIVRLKKRMNPNKSEMN